MEYSYKRIGQRDYPIISMDIKSNLRTKQTHALIDSGSMLSLFGLEVANELGILYKNGKPTRIASVHGELLVYIHSLHLIIMNHEFSCQVGFSDEFKANVNLLGRMDFFDNFLITFDEKHKKVVLDKY
ncbi:hypothetical protein J4207_00520 [Candidatus Woesearchaeota archaeon]|nr:hypothetical protein [Candidatus Woesearchaeota archaeon]